MKITAEPRSDQWNADDFVGGPRVFTVSGVKVGTAEQKYDIDLAEGQGRSWRPPLTVLRILIAAWGDEADAWVGRRVELYRDDSVRFGPEAVGGIRVRALSDLPGNKPLDVKVTTSRGKRGTIRVQPLPDAAPTPAGITADQQRDLHTAFNNLGITDRGKRLKYASQITGRVVGSANELTHDEAGDVLAAIRTDLAARPASEEDQA